LGKRENKRRPIRRDASSIIRDPSSVIHHP
jgi:hypothetical protein